MNTLKISLVFALSLFIINCSSVEVKQKDENLFVLKSWGGKNKTNEQLKTLLADKAKELCSPGTFKYEGSGVFDTKIPGLSQAIGGFATYDPDNITKTYSRHVRCTQK